MKINFDRIDKRISGFMNKWGVNALRYSLAIIFVWFGILKVLGISPAEKLVLATVYWLPFFTPQSWLIIIGWWEVFIGIFLCPPCCWAPGLPGGCGATTGCAISTRCRRPT